MTMTAPPVDDPGAAGDEPASPPDPAALFDELSGEARVMLARDVALAKAELQLAVRHAKATGTGFGVAALVGYLALAMVAVAAALGLAEVVAAWVAFLAVGLVLAAIAGVAYAAGRRNLEALSPVPHHTIENIKEDISWLRARMS